jgi:hypothetical protein
MGPAPFYEGRKLAQTLHEFWLAQFLLVREGTREELLHDEGIYNMHYFLACRTSLTSTVCNLSMLREASVSLKLPASISGGNLTIKYDCPYLDKIFRFEKMNRLSETLLDETYHLAHSKGPNSKTSWLCTLQEITLP